MVLSMVTLRILIIWRFFDLAEFRHKFPDLMSKYAKTANFGEFSVSAGLEGRHFYRYKWEPLCV